MNAGGGDGVAVVDDSGDVDAVCGVAIATGEMWSLYMHVIW